MKQYFKTLTGKLWIYFIVIFLVPFFGVGVFFYSQSKAAAEEQLINDRNIILLQAKNSVYNVLTNASAACNSLYNDTNVRNYLISDLNNIDNNSYKSIDKVFELLSFSNVLINDTCNISIIRMDGWFTSMKENKRGIGLKNNIKRWEEEVSAEDLYISFASKDIGKALTDDGTVATMVKKVYDIRQSNTTGFVVVDIMSAAFQEIFSSIGKETFSDIMLCDTEGNVIVSSQGLLGQKMVNIRGEGSYLLQSIDNKKYAVIKNEVGLYNLSLLAYIPFSEVEGSIRHSLVYLLAIFSMVILFTYVIALFMTRRIGNPIKKLINKMNYSDKDNRVAIVDIKGSYEIEQLSYRYNAMLEEIDSLIEEIKASEQEKLEFEINALQSQINPHFIYNTLSTIRWMAIIQNEDSIVKMLDSFIGLMKYSSNFKESLIVLEDEISFLEDYVFIQNARYNSQINFYADFEPEAKKCRILKFILQPLVENSIFHGFNSHSEEKVIRITSWIQDEKIYLEVMDNGQGMDQETLQKIMDRKYINNGLTSIGLPNVERRIQARFGEEYGLKITSAANKGCLVTVVLPKI